MTSTVFAFLLAATSMQAANVNTARNAYLDCLRDFMRTSLQARTEPPAFQTALATQCTAQGEAFRSTLIRHDARNGGNRAASESDFRATRDEAIENILGRYRVYFSNNQVPN
jgi:hypothetical protein